MTAATDGNGTALRDKLPPVTISIVASMALVIVSGIYLASHLPSRAPMGPVVGLLVAAALLFFMSAAAVARVRPFAWEAFFRVGGWTLLAYGAISGMLEFIFVFDHTRGSELVVLTLSLLLFALDIPLLLAFSVARFQQPRSG